MSAPQTPLRIALIGAGAIGRVHAEAIRLARGVELIAVCDADAESARRVALENGTRSYTSFFALAQEESPDAVVVATPPNTHRSIAEFFASRAIHVLCEKPFATDVAGARSMIACAKNAGSIVSMASKFRFVTDVRAAREAIAAGKIGELRSIDVAFTSRVDMRSRWNGDREIAGGGVIIDNGTHAMDIFRYIGGPLSSVRATEPVRHQDIAVEDTATVCARFGAGGVATADLSWSLDKRLTQYLRICGDDGAIELGWAGSRMKTAADSQWVEFGSGYAKMRAFVGVIENFAGAIRGENALEVTAADALASVEAVDAAYASLRFNMWIEVGAGTMVEVA
ncbi:MAG TPA: Gfo/Idh/MocA family oxidoreductase [Candidatus Baltobacteraceae bacterium]|jgi:predicted dehydrogenase